MAQSHCKANKGGECVSHFNKGRDSFYKMEVCPNAGIPFDKIYRGLIRIGSLTSHKCGRTCTEIVTHGRAVNKDIFKGKESAYEGARESTTWGCERSRD